MLKKYLEYLQTRSFQTKTRILSGVVMIGIITVGALWISSIKNSFNGISVDDLLNPQQGTVLSAAKYFAVESLEKKNDKTYLYFKVANNTQDILTLPAVSDIKLTLDNGQTLTPNSILNRQQQPFVKKVLNNTTNYGVLVFNNFDQKRGTLEINNFYFEQNTQQFFKEAIELNFKEIESLQELRS